MIVSETFTGNIYNLVNTVASLYYYYYFILVHNPKQKPFHLSKKKGRRNVKQTLDFMLPQCIFIVVLNKKSRMLLFWHQTLPTVWIIYGGKKKVFSNLNLGRRKFLFM